MQRFRCFSKPHNPKKPSYPNPQQSPLRRRHQINFSIGKSISSIKAQQKIVKIKQKCFEYQQTQSQSPFQLKKHHKSEYDQQCYLNEEESEPDTAQIQKNSHLGSFLLKSKYKGRPPTIFFQYPACCEMQNPLNEELAPRITSVAQIELKYKIYGSHYKCIINAFQYNGYPEGSGPDWDVYFDVRGSKVRKIYNSMDEQKKFNHFAGCWHIGRKDQLCRSIQKQKKLFPQEYNFLPKTYIFPNDYQRFETARQMSDQSQLWIQKPVASSLGRNIKVLSNQSTVRKRRNILISEYISNPHLINKLKYDLRIYVLVTSYNPLKIYMFENGLARFATQTYSKKHLSKKFVHLTNFSINKKSKNYVKNMGDEEKSETASKWSLHRLFQHYREIGIDPDDIQSQIQDIVIKTCIAAEPNMVAPKYRYEDKRNCGFEIYGFDILIDDKFKAWLIEVNVCPSLCSSSAFDRKIKHTLLVDLLNLIGVRQPSNKEVQSPKKSEIKRYRFKNIHNVADLCVENCLQLLEPEDWLILLESEEQFERCGHFKRIFPQKSNILKYQSLFQCQRYNNFILWKHLLSSKGLLSRLKLQPV